MDAVERSQFVRENMRLATWWARRYDRRGIDPQDLNQAGYLGLCEAARRYDDTRDIAFGTYANHWIRHCIQEEVRRRSPITMPARAIRAKQSWPRFDDMPDDVMADEDSGPDRDDVATAIGKALAILTPRQREIVVLCYGIGTDEPLARSEVAARMGICIETVNTQMHRVRATLARLSREE